MTSASTNSLGRHVSILTVPALVAVVSGAHVLQAFRTDLGAGKGSVVAKTLHSSGDVKKRFSSSFRWYDVAPQEGLVDRSSLRTAEGETKLKFMDGTELKLGPNSLVVLEKGPEGKPIVRVSRGKVRLEGKGKVSLKLPEQELSLDQAKADVEVRFGASKLALLAGSAAGVSQVNSKPISIASGQSETFVRQDVGVEAPVAVAAPAPPPAVTQSKAAVESAVVSGDLKVMPTRIKAAGKSTSTALGESATLSQIEMTLEWVAIEGASEYRIGFFEKSGKKVDEVVTNLPKLAHKIKSVSEFDRTYQIATIVGGKELKSSQVPIKIDFTAPSLVNPKAGAEFPSKASVLLTWQKTLLTDGYELETSLQSRFETSQKQVLKANFVTLSGLKNGTYFWRVRSLLGNHKSPWSKPRSFRVSS